MAKPPRTPAYAVSSARNGLVRIVRGLIDSDPAAIERATREMGHRRRWLTPLAFAAGAVAMTVVGVKPLLRNWKLTIVELVPAAWLWVSMYNLKQHVLNGNEPRFVHIQWAIPIMAIFIALAVIAFLCNAMFALSLGSDDKRVRTMAQEAWLHRRLLVGWGLAIGLAHSVVTLWLARVGPLAYDIGLSVVIAVSMVTFITVPANLAGVRKRSASRRDKMAAAAVGGTLAAVVSAPGFIMDRVGLLMLSIHGIHWLGFVFLSIGVALQVAATTSTRAVKFSTMLVTGEQRGDDATRAEEAHTAN